MIQHVNKVNTLSRTHHHKSLQDAVQDALVEIVLPGAPRVHGVGYQTEHDLHALLLGALQVEPPPEVLQNLRSSFEAGATRRGHHLHQLHDALGVLPHRQVALNAEYLVVVESLRRGARVVAVHHLEVLASELEGGRFEVDTPGRGGKHEVEVDVV